LINLLKIPAYNMVWINNQTVLSGKVLLANRSVAITSKKVTWNLAVFSRCWNNKKTYWWLRDAPQAPTSIGQWWRVPQEE